MGSVRKTAFSSLAHNKGHRFDIITPKLMSKPQREVFLDVFDEAPPRALGVDGVVHVPVELELVMPRSPIGTRDALESLAYYQRRELGYDFPCYAASEDNDEPRDRHFLVRTDDFDSRAIGGIGFRWRERSDRPHGISLAWLWFHPYFRSRGILSALWPFFRKHLGDFTVERPLSAAMKAFLAKRGECSSCGRKACRCSVKRTEEDPRP